MGNYMIAEIDKEQLVMPDKIIDKKIEIEQKFFCKDSGELISMLNNMDFQIESQNQETDEYFTDINSVYVKNRTCLRIRKTDNRKAELTFKGKSKIFSSFYAKTESNLNLGAADCEEMATMLSSLGYLSYSVVRKNRKTYSKTENNIVLNVMIDEIEDVGNFVEFELICKDDKIDTEKLSKILLDFVEQFKPLNLETANLPYRDFVAKSVYDKIRPDGEFKYLLLDLDGTLINSEKAFFESFKKVLQTHYSVDISRKDYEENELKKNANLIISLKESGKISQDVKDADIMNLVYKEYEKEFDNVVVEESSVANFEILKQLKEKKMKLGLVSTSKRSFINILVKKLEIPDLFDTIVAREDVKNLKPAPDAYIEAMKILNAQPNECLVIEDSARGIAAAVDAGLKVIKARDYSGIAVPDNILEFDKISRILLVVYNNM